MIIIAVILLIRLGFIASASPGRTGIYYYQTVLSRVRARFTRSYTRAVYDIYLSLSVRVCIRSHIYKIEMPYRRLVDTLAPATRYRD